MTANASRIALRAFDRGSNASASDDRDRRDEECLSEYMFMVLPSYIRDGKQT
jgi:hypothetical protein